MLSPPFFSLRARNGRNSHRAAHKEKKGGESIQHSLSLEILSLPSHTFQRSGILGYGLNVPTFGTFLYHASTAYAFDIRNTGKRCAVHSKRAREMRREWDRATTTCCCPWNTH